VKPRQLLVVGVVVAAIAVAAVVLSRAAGPLSIRGSVALRGGPFQAGQPCAGEGRLAEMREGGAIYVGMTDVDESIRGTLGAGTADSASLCRFPFVVDGVPRGFEQYRLEVFDRDFNILGAVYHLTESDAARPQVVDVP
jgi:hypothetical protein